MAASAPDEQQWRHAPRWEALLASLAIGLAFALLPDDLRFGPRWLLGVLIVAFAVPLNAARFLGNYRLVRVLGIALSALVTVAIIASTVLLIARLPGGKA